MTWDKKIKKPQFCTILQLLAKMYASSFGWLGWEKQLWGTLHNLLHTLQDSIWYSISLLTMIFWQRENLLGLGLDIKAFHYLSMAHLNHFLNCLFLPIFLVTLECESCYCRTSKIKSKLITIPTARTCAQGTVSFHLETTNFWLLMLILRMMSHGN